MRETELAGRWDFSAESLDVLEKLVRTRYRDEDDIAAGRMDAFVQGAVWYVGEAACRGKGLVWRYWPFNGGGGALPDLFGSGAPGVIDTPSVDWPGAAVGQGLSPLGLMIELYSTEDDIDRPIETHLRDILTFRLAVLDDDPALDGIDWVELDCRDFHRFRQAVSDHLEPAGLGQSFPGSAAESRLAGLLDRECRCPTGGGAAGHPGRAGRSPGDRL